MQKNNLVDLYSSAFFHLCVEKKTNLKESLENIEQIIVLFKSKNYFFWNWLLSLNDDDLRLTIKDLFYSKVDSNFFNFLQVLLDDRVFFYFLSILETVQKLFLKKLNFKIIKLYSTVPLKIEQLKKIKANLIKRLKSEVKIFSFLDVDLIGGVRLEGDDFVFDNSIRKKIFDINENLLLWNE